MHDTQKAGAANLEAIYRFLRKKTNESVTSELIQLPKEIDDYPEFLRLFNVQRFLQKTPKYGVFSVDILGKLTLLFIAA